MSGKFESLSAMMDGEASELELRRTLKAVDGDGELSDTWRRYHLAQSLIKGQKIESKIDISAGVMSAIGAMETDSTASHSDNAVTAQRSSWMQGAASMAVAASVTLAVMLGVQHFSSPDASLLGTPQAGVIARTSNNADLMQTSLSGQAKAESAPVIEVIRLSEDMRSSILSYKQTLTALNADWQPSWLPQGYISAGVQLTAQGVTRLYSKEGNLLTLSVQPLTESSPAAGSYSDQGVTALGRVVDQSFVSLVGALTLDDADRVISSVEWSNASAK